MKPFRTSLLLCLAGALTIGAVPALGQYPQTRKGFWFNVGLGWGSLGCNGCGSRTGGLSGGLSLGGTISPTFLLGGGTTGWTKSENGATLTVGTLDLRARFYPAAKGGFFLTGGIGLGSISAGFGGISASETGVGVVLGLGYDFRIARTVSLTPYFNGIGVKTSSSDANVVQLGLSVTIH
ncbi:MAG: outer membrane beta-barrel protein [Gemmatimonadales bacterium]